MKRALSYISAGALAAGVAQAFKVPIADTDSLREVCSGMWGGSKANIELSFNPGSEGQVALVIYEWNDVHYLGAETDPSGDQPKTYICTTSAVRSGMCQSYQLGSFTTTLPEGTPLDSTSIFTQAIKFSSEDSAPDADPYPSNEPQSEDDGEPPLDPALGSSDTAGEDYAEKLAPSSTGSPPTYNKESTSVVDLPDVAAPDYVPVAAAEETEEEQIDAEIAAGLIDDDVVRLRRQEQFKRKRGLFDSIFGGGHKDEPTQEDQKPGSSPEYQNEEPAPIGQEDGISYADTEVPGTPQPVEDLPYESSAPGDTLDEAAPGHQQDAAEPENANFPQDDRPLAGGLDDVDRPSRPGSSDAEQASPPAEQTEPAWQGDDDPPAEEAQPKNPNADRPVESSSPPYGEDQGDGDDQISRPPAQDEPEYSSNPQPAGSTGATVYRQPIFYPVPKTGYYCVGIVPVTLVESRSLEVRQIATHAEYTGLVTFHNVFDGELPAVDYPKINFYLLLSVVYTALGLGWALLCIKHRDELLPMQYYISGTIVFLIIEMLANFAYYRYINKHGGGASSLAFLFVVSILNAARNSLSFFLLLIVSMGLSVVRQSLGGVMNRVRVLTAMHFIFGVLYSVGTVEVELESASLILIMFLIFPLALTLTAFLMWIIISLNGTIMFLQANKQRSKLRMFQRLWRILILAVIAIAAFFVISSMSLSNRLDEDYAPKNWRYRWFLLDGSLAVIYLAVFSAVAWLWRPTANNRSFAMSQELAQDEAEADAEDYEFSNMDDGRNAHRALNQEDDYEGIDRERDYDDDGKRKYGRTGGRKGEVNDENTVFALDDSDDEGSDDGRKRSGVGGGYRDDDSDGEDKKRRD